MNLPGFQSKDLSEVFQDSQLREYGRVTYDSSAIGRSKNERNAFVVIPQVHGNIATQFEIRNDTYASSFLNHHNQIRLLASAITGRNSHVYKEGLPMGSKINVEYLAEVYKYECRVGIETLLKDVSVHLLPPTLQNRLQEIERKEWDFEEQLHYINGSMRHLAWCVMNGLTVDHIHGIEPLQSEEMLQALAEMDPFVAAFTVMADLPTLNLKRNTSIIQEVRETLANGEIGVLVFGSGHVSNEEKEAQLAGEVLQDAFARELRETRFVILEPKDMPNR